MKKFSDYISEEMEKALNENTSQIGVTDTFKGNDVMGAHHHEYWIFDETGYGRTSDALAEPANLNEPTPVSKVGGHIHFIDGNGQVRPAGDGHTHKLLPPQKVGPDTEIFSCCKCDSHNNVPVPAAI